MQRRPNVLDVIEGRWNNVVCIQGNWKIDIIYTPIDDTIHGTITILGWFLIPWMVSDIELIVYGSIGKSYDQVDT